jgi:hypothetical protein
MKAAVYHQNGGPEVFRYEDVADPVCGPKAVAHERLLSSRRSGVIERSGGSCVDCALESPCVQRLGEKWHDPCQSRFRERVPNHEHRRQP